MVETSNTPKLPQHVSGYWIV